MSLDTPAPQESNASLSVRDAAAFFGAEPEEQQQPAQADPAKVEPEKAPEATQADADPEKVADATTEPERVTIEVDGKTVELTKAELAEHYKNGLRQADYTRKTMEAAEQRKAAEAESAKAREERQRYAQGLQQTRALLEAQLQEQSQIDWHRLRETDSQEFLRQWHLYQERQANLQNVNQQQQHLTAVQKEEQAKAMQAHVAQQQEELLAKLPEWKDPAKAKAEQSAIKDFLKSNGFEESLIDSIADHRQVLIARKAMLYDQMMDKAKAAAKKVESLPQKVERPGVADTNPTDGRTAAMKRLGQEKSVRAAADVFAKLF